MTNYILIKKDGTYERFVWYADLINTFLKEYGKYPYRANQVEGLNRYYY